VVADETDRSCRRTPDAWELVRDGIQTTVITDNTGGALMHQGRIDLVVVGADRHRGQRDTANKIGTYGSRFWRGSMTSRFTSRPPSTIDLDSRRSAHSERRTQRARGDPCRRHQLTPTARSSGIRRSTSRRTAFIAGIITEREFVERPTRSRSQASFPTRPYGAPH